MEVHHHTSASGKKWTHYLWEFFMLFLAVTLGFFVENQREHYVEHQREKQYMKSMVEDLRSDTAELRKTISRVDTSLQCIDSMLSLLTADHVTDQAVIRSYQFTFPALNNLPVIFNDRTITQLKNSGNMRLIRNQKVNDGILYYWGRVELIAKSLDRHMAYRTKGRDMETMIFNIARIYLKNKRMMWNSEGLVQLVRQDPELVREYANIIAYCGVMLSGLKDQVKDQGRLATGLIDLIKKEYHLE